MKADNDGTVAIGHRPWFITHEWVIQPWSATFGRWGPRLFSVAVYGTEGPSIATSKSALVSEPMVMGVGGGGISPPPLPPSPPSPIMMSGSGPAGGEASVG